MSVWDQVIADMKKRDEVGWARYRKALTPHDGRDSLRDAYEEALDLVVYLKKEMLERIDKDKLIKAQADRIASQSEALSRVAEKQGV